ncbi:MAG: integrase core domain-containing protein, partial [Gammaproteobacteria bacterium]
MFDDESRDYTAAMLDFVAAATKPPAAGSDGNAAQAPTLKAQKRALHQAEAQLRDERRAVRQRRQVEDAAWQALNHERQRAQRATSEDTASQRQAQDGLWRALCRQRKETLVDRKAADQGWRQTRLTFRQQWSQLPIVTAWIAILVITDNCSRQCCGLPLFLAGPRVTAEMIVEALHSLLPPELLFLITDRGIHFRAEAFHRLARQEEFIHVLIARHRPQTNGIAERFVRTLKAWLRDKSWQDDQELAALLDQFLVEYNDAPHQGIAIPGLSP